MNKAKQIAKEISNHFQKLGEKELKRMGKEDGKKLAKAINDMHKMRRKLHEPGRWIGEQS